MEIDKILLNFYVQIIADNILDFGVQMSSVLLNELNVCDWGMVSNEQRAA